MYKRVLLGVLLRTLATSQQVTVLGFRTLPPLQCNSCIFFLKSQLCRCDLGAHPPPTTELFSIFAVLSFTSCHRAATLGSGPGPSPRQPHLNSPIACHTVVVATLCPSQVGAFGGSVSESADTSAWTGTNCYGSVAHSGCNEVGSTGARATTGTNSYGSMAHNRCHKVSSTGARAATRTNCCGPVAQKG